jgi:mutator family transposase
VERLPREGQFDTRPGTIELLVPKLRSGSYFPDWLVERRDGPNEWQVCHRYMGTELLATARMTVVDAESEEPKEVIGELVAAG